MSSTDDGPRDDAVRRFFEKRLLPAAAAASRRRGELFPRAPQPECESYYRERGRRVMERRDFELQGLESPGALAQAAARMWREGDLPELADLADALASLAGELREVEEEGGEVSPFIYVMF